MNRLFLTRLRLPRLTWALAAALVPAAGFAISLDDIEQDPIRYSASRPDDAVAQLQRQIDSGAVALKYDPSHGYLPAVLKQLQVPVSSQMLVFSKTSFQRERISPNEPRAIYFNDRAYVGWVQGGPVMELSTVDPQLGAVFYTLEQSPAAKPKFVRQTDECLSCHGSTLTRDVPGHVMRSVYTGRDGLPLLAAGAFITTDESPLRERWGGWYVTGTHGDQVHMGNVALGSAAEAQSMDMAKGANVTDLRRLVDTRPYLSKHSDIVALMVIEHQTNVQNLIAKASYETRRALYYEEAINRELGRPAGYRSESTVSRIKSAAEPLVRALLLSGEAPLTAPVRGTSSFAAEFAAAGPRDRQGRSLRELDLQRRLFRYPCSYLIYSGAFDALPAPAKEYVYGRLRQVLSGEDRSPPFAHLSNTDRSAVLEILRETKPGFPAN